MSGVYDAERRKSKTYDEGSSLREWTGKKEYWNQQLLSGRLFGSAIGKVRNCVYACVFDSAGYMGNGQNGRTDVDDQPTGIF